MPGGRDGAAAERRTAQWPFDLDGWADAGAARAFRATGADILWRASVSFALKPEIWALFAVYQAICKLTGIAVNAAAPRPGRAGAPDGTRAIFQLGLPPRHS